MLDCISDVKKFNSCIHVYIYRYISVLNKIMKLNVYCFIFLYALFKLKLIFNNTQKSIFIDNNIISPAFF